MGQTLLSVDENGGDRKYLWAFIHFFSRNMSITFIKGREFMEDQAGCEWKLYVDLTFIIVINSFRIKPLPKCSCILANNKSHQSLLCIEERKYYRIINFKQRRHFIVLLFFWRFNFWQECAAHIAANSIEYPCLLSLKWYPCLWSLSIF